MAPVSLDRIDPPLWRRYREAIMALQEASYEPGRRDKPEYFEAVVMEPRSASILARTDGEVVGYCFAAPLEHFVQINGVAQDPNFGFDNTLYAADVTVAGSCRGQGLGRRLKTRQLEYARSLGYRFVSGRNRVGLADAMWRLNQSLGAEELFRLLDDYPDGPRPRDAIYYHIDLNAGRLETA